MNFLVDAQLPPALARALADMGHDAVHVIDLGLEAAADPIIWKEAALRGAAIVTKDENFVGGGTVRFVKPGPPVVWIRFGNVSRRVLLNRFLPLPPQVLAMLAAGEKIIEVRDR